MEEVGAAVVKARAVKRTSLDQYQSSLHQSIYMASEATLTALRHTTAAATLASRQ